MASPLLLASAASQKKLEMGAADTTATATHGRCWSRSQQREKESERELIFFGLGQHKADVTEEERDDIIGDGFHQWRR